MIEYNAVQSMEKPQNIIVDEYSVWVNTDIKQIEVSNENGIHTEFQFCQIRYTKDEYIKLLIEQNQSLETEITNTQIALTEIYESMGGN